MIKSGSIEEAILQTAVKEAKGDMRAALDALMHATANMAANAASSQPHCASLSLQYVQVFLEMLGRNMGERGK